MPALNPTLTTIARRNHGVLTRADATGAGVSGQQLRRAVERGELDRLHPGVFRIAGAPWTLHQGLLLAVLAGGPGTLASHRSAAYLWGLDGSRPGQPEIVTPRHLRSRSATARCHESTDLHLAQATERDRVPCTGIARTLVDLGAVVPVERVQQSVDDAVRRRLCSWEDLLHALAMHSRRGRRGVGALRAVLDATCGEPVPDSRFNRLVERLILDSSLRPPTVEFEVRDGAGRFIAASTWPIRPSRSPSSWTVVASTCPARPSSATGSARTPWNSKAGSSSATPGCSTEPSPGASSPTSVPPSPAAEPISPRTCVRPGRPAPPSDASPAGLSNKTNWRRIKASCAQFRRKFDLVAYTPGSGVR